VVFPEVSPRQETLELALNGLREIAQQWETR
jgi:hypothetical protein